MSVKYFICMNLMWISFTATKW